MTPAELMENAELSEAPEVLVEINGTVHAVHDVHDTASGLILIVDIDQEEREMR
jgi:hypothetical protein